MNIIDSHCHLDYEPMYSNLDNVIKRAHESNIKYMLTISVKDDKYDNILSITKKFTNVYGTYGIHPHEAKNHNKINKEIILKKIKMSDKIIGIGETGLDFYYNNSDKTAQIESFNKHIEAAITTKVPIIIHSRNAENETFDILNSYKDQKLKILMHCFTGSKEFAHKLLELDSFFSASGIITFKNSTTLQDTFKTIPLNKLLIETDSPFLAPVPNRGKKNEPSFIEHTAKRLAEIKNISKNDLIKATTDNFNNLFS